MKQMPKTINKKILTATVVALLGITGEATTTASAAVVADGTYNLVINPTPGTLTSSGGISYKFGKDGAWNSNFTFGGNLPNSVSWAMTDNAVLVTGSDNITRGSSIGGDGYAGIFGIHVAGGSYTVNSVASMGGTIDQNTGAMTFNPTGRYGALSAPNTFYDRKWNVDDCTITSTGCVANGNTLWSVFSTGDASSSYVDAAGIRTYTTIHGAAVTNLGDVNGDGKADYGAILVSGGYTGSEWTAFSGVGYFEIWNISLLSTNVPHSGFNEDSILNTAAGDVALYAPVPIPGAVWLFGSGLFALLGPALRRRSGISR